MERLSNLLDFFKNFSSIKSPWLLFEGEWDAAEINLLRTLLKSSKGDRRELKFYEIKKDGPTPDLEAEFLTMDMFSTAKIFFLTLKSNPKDWDEEASTIWKKLQKHSDFQSNWLFVTGDAKITEKIETPLKVFVEKAPVEALAWLQFYNVLAGAEISRDRLEFLSHLQFEDLGELFQSIDLWSLGGDDWAKHSLGWGVPHSNDHQSQQRPGENLSYAWVDAALSQNKVKYLRCLHDLVERNGEDPIRLWALLGKSIKIQAQLALGDDPLGEAPFLIQKLKRVPYRSELLDYWCECDLAMKGTRVDVLTKLMNLC